MADDFDEDTKHELPRGGRVQDMVQRFSTLETKEQVHEPRVALQQPKVPDPEASDSPPVQSRQGKSDHQRHAIHGFDMNTYQSTAMTEEDAIKKALSESVRAEQSSAEKPSSGKAAAKPKYHKHYSKAKKNDSALFKKPSQLIFTDVNTERLRCDETTLKLLSEINQPMSVVAITGLYRTGKSYLLNRLAGETTGFKIGRQTNACTKGIWIWCRHHPYYEDQVLVLLDVEGFGDLDKVNRREDTSLFTLATLLSSTLVYNKMGILDSYALDRLNFLEDIDSTIQVSQNEEYKEHLDFDFFFPYFIVTLRDFQLDMVDKRGDHITPDEYLEGALVQKRGDGQDIAKYNRIRLLIRRYFNNRKCFVFIPPCGPKAKLEKLSRKEIEPDFLESLDEFSEYIFSLEPLQLKSCRKINGRMLANLALHYVSGISQNKQPSILEARRYMIQIENQNSVATASDLYEKHMQDFIGKMGEAIPTDDSLVNYHEECLEVALEYFKQTVLFDDEDVFQRKAMTAFKCLLNKFKRTCDEKSKKVCTEALARLNRRVEKKLRSGAYSCKSGYDKYIADINWIARKYYGITGLGEHASGILQTFIDNKEKEEEFVYRMALNAQKDEGDKRAMDTTFRSRQQAKRGDQKTTTSKFGTLQKDMKQRIYQIEQHVNKDLEQQYKEERAKIQRNYIGNLRLKIKELERQKAETHDDEERLKEIVEQLDTFETVLDYTTRLEQEERESVDSKDHTDTDKEEGEEESPAHKEKKKCKVQ